MTHTSLIRGLLTLVLCIAGNLQALTLFGTLGTNETLSTLVEIQPSSGSIVRAVGAVGYRVNGMAFDSATGVLYGTTAAANPSLGNVLIKIDLATGAGASVGTGAGRQISLPAISPTGTLYAWSDDPAESNRLVKIDKTTGIATVVGNPQIQAFAHSLAFGVDGALYLFNGNGNLYTLDPSSAVATSQGNVLGLPNGYAHHGAINPVSGLLRGLTALAGAPSPQIATIDLVAHGVTNVVSADPALQTLSWVVLPTTLTVTRNGSGTGTVLSSDSRIQCGTTCSFTYIDAPLVNVDAVPSPHAFFTGWLGACTGRATCNLDLSKNANITATFAPDSLGTHGVDEDGDPTFEIKTVLDIDHDATINALTDGLLVLRGLFGLAGAALTTNATGAGATRDSAAIATYINDVLPRFDVDGNGKVDALTDGVMILRYLFGLRGDSLIASAIGMGATRTGSVQIEAHIQGLLQ